MSSKSKRKSTPDRRSRAVAGGAADSVPSPTGMAVTRQELHIGPIPSAAELQRYREIDENLPSRIVGMAEAELEHRIEVGGKAVDAEIGDRQAMRREVRLGQLLGFILAFVGIGGGVAAMILSPDWVGQLSGGVLSGGVLLALVKALIVARGSDPPSR